MTIGRIACALAIFVIFGVLAIFLFHGIEGPYSAVHGPVTALLSIRGAAILRLAIARAALRMVRGAMACALVVIYWSAFSYADSGGGIVSAHCGSVLRC